MYITKTDVENRLNRTLTDEEATIVEDLMIPAIQKYVENYTGRYFEAQSSADYWYLGKDKYYLEIDEFLTVSSIKAYDSDGDLQDTLDTSDYELFPYNTDYKNLVHSLEGHFADYKYKVTGELGYSTTAPYDIKLVCLELVSGLVDRKSGITKESIEGYSYELGNLVENNPVVKETLGHYKRILV